MADFFKNIYHGAMMGAYVAHHMVSEALDDAVTRLTGRNNGIDDVVSGTQRIKLASVQQDIKIPKPTADDKKWAKQYRKASSHAVEEALEEAILNGQNWRALYLVNRPYKMTYLFGPSHYGFSANIQLDSAMHAAAKADNVTAAYILLKYAEKNPSHIASTDGKVTDRMRDFEVDGVCYRGLRSALQHNADKVTKLLSETIGDFSRAYAQGNVESFDMSLRNVVESSIIHGNTTHWDMLKSNGVRAETFQGAIEDTFQRDGFRGMKKLLPTGTREKYLDWAKNSGMADDAFVKKMRGLEAAEAAAIAKAKADDSYYQNIVGGGRRRFSKDTPDSTVFNDCIVNYTRIDEQSVEATITDMDGRKETKEISAKFNFASRKVTLDGADMSMDDYAQQGGFAPSILACAKEDWKEQQAYNRLPPPPFKRAKVVKF